MNCSDEIFGNHRTRDTYRRGDVPSRLLAGDVPPFGVTLRSVSAPHCSLETSDSTAYRLRMSRTISGHKSAIGHGLSRELVAGPPFETVPFEQVPIGRNPRESAMSQVGQPYQRLAVVQ
jgi:hypothetical protein